MRVCKYTYEDVHHVEAARRIQAGVDNRVVDVVLRRHGESRGYGRGGRVDILLEVVLGEERC